MTARTAARAVAAADTATRTIPPRVCIAAPHDGILFRKLSRRLSFHRDWSIERGSSGGDAVRRVRGARGAGVEQRGGPARPAAERPRTSYHHANRTEGTEMSSLPPAAQRPPVRANERFQAHAANLIGHDTEAIFTYLYRTTPVSDSEQAAT